MKVEGRWRRSIEPADAGDAVVVLDQTRLPYAIAWLRIDDLAGAARAIRDMHVRGAPLIGATAASSPAMRSSAQRRLIAVGRVAARVARAAASPASLGSTRIASATP